MSLVNIKAQIDDRELTQRLRKLGKMDLKRAFNNIGQDMKIMVRDNIQSATDPVTGRPWPKLAPVTQQVKPKGAGNPLQDTTRLLRSFNSSRPQVTSTSVQIGTNVPYARIHQQGGVIRAKKAKYLTIPVAPEARRAKTFTRFWDQCVAKGQSPAIITSRRGNKLMVYYKGASAARSNVKTKKTRKARTGKLTVAWLLKKQVVIPRRRYAGFTKTFQNMVTARLIEALEFKNQRAEAKAAQQQAPPGKEYW